MLVLAGVCRIETDVGHTRTAPLLHSLGGGSSAVSLPSEEHLLTLSAKVCPKVPQMFGDQDDLASMFYLSQSAPRSMGMISL